MKFIDSHPDYQGYQSSDEHAVSGLPARFSSALHGWVVKELTNQQLQKALHWIARTIHDDPPQHWGGDFLRNEAEGFLSNLVEKSMPKTMDFLAVLVSDVSYGIRIADLNEFLEDLGVGYELSEDDYEDHEWKLRPPITQKTKGIDESMQQVGDICQQTMEHLQQAKELLLTSKTERGGKAAVWACMSAMEAFLKTLSGEKTVQKATKLLQNESTWGPKSIVKDGVSLWEEIHRLYPDVRHGTSEGSSMPESQALYWINRMNAFVQYMTEIEKSKQ